jgi:hypothetical protein
MATRWTSPRKEESGGDGSGGLGGREAGGEEVLR